MSAHDGLAARRPPLPPPPTPHPCFWHNSRRSGSTWLGGGRGRGAALQLLCYLAEAEAARHSTR